MHSVAGRICVFQTSDAFRYRNMLDATSKPCRAFCEKHSVEYNSYIGIWRGFYSWHATYNRIPFLLDKVEQGFDGWVIYIDADAFIVDIEFDIRAYLLDKGEFAVIGSKSGASDHFWDMNIGVMLFNISNPFTKFLIRKWSEFFLKYSNDDLLRAEVWEKDMPSDQGMFHMTLDKYPDKAHLIYHESRTLINSLEASFIRQVLRADGGDFESREAKVIAMASKAMAPQEI